MSTLAPAAVRADLDDAGAAALRAERRARLFDSMARHGLDALVLSRPDDVAYATGARQLWIAGTKPVGPSCLLVAATGRIHMVSVSADGVPAEIPHDDLLPRSWNPATLRAALGAIPGLADATRIGTDSSRPGFPERLSGLAPGAEVVDGRDAIWSARTPKTPAELAHMRAATAIAAAGLDAMRHALLPGITERELLAVHLDAIASLGAPVPPTEGVACVTSRRGPVHLHRLARDRRAELGSPVVLDAGALVAGYEGGVGRTAVAGSEPDSAQRELAARCRAALNAVITACRTGATGADIRKAWDATGEARPPVPIVNGVGLGMEPPLVGCSGYSGGNSGDKGDDDDTDEDPVTLVEGSVLGVTSWVAAEGVGGWLERDLVVVGDTPTLLGAAADGGAR